MAFPTTALKDDFNRTDEAPIAGGLWTGPIINGHARNRIVSNVAAPDAGGNTCTNYLSSSYLADQEIYFTVPTLPESGTGIAMWARIANPNTGTASAVLAAYDVGSGFRIWDLTNAGTYTQLGSSVAGTMVAGDKLGLELIGTTVNMYWYTGGTWTTIMTVTTSLTNNGYIGFGSSGTAVRADDYGGGEISSVSLDSALPDADIVTTGWTTTPLFSKVNDASDATVIQATAA